MRRALGTWLRIQNVRFLIHSDMNCKPLAPHLGTVPKVPNCSMPGQKVSLVEVARNHVNDCLDSNRTCKVVTVQNSAGADL